MKPVILFNLFIFFLLSGNIIAAPLQDVSAVSNTHALVAQGWAVENQGRMQEALALYYQALQIDPNDYLVHKHIGIHWVRLGKYAQGIEEIKRAVELDPSDASSYYNLGIAYEKAKDDQKALDSFDQAIKIYPRYFNALYNRAYVRWILKDYVGAIKDFSQSAAINPRAMTAFLYLFSFVLFVVLMLAFAVWNWYKTNLIVRGNLQTAAMVIHSNMMGQTGFNSMEGTYKGRKIMVNYNPWAKYGKVSVNTPVHPPVPVMFSRPTEFTSLIGNELYYSKIFKANDEWQQKTLSQEEISLTLDRLVQGADAVESGKLPDQAISQEAKAVLRNNARIFFIGLGLSFAVIILAMGRDSSNHPRHTGQFLGQLVILLLPAAIYFFSKRR